MRKFAPSESAASVLRSVEAVDWSRLRHLRGPASDVPGLLRGLVADDDETRRHALRTLGARVLPFYDGIDGAVCEVTSHVVPFLARLAATDAPGAADLLVVLRRIASVAWDRDPYPERPVTALELRSRMAYARDSALADLARRVLVPPSAPRSPHGRWQKVTATMRDASAALFRHFDPVAAELLYGYRAHVALADSLPTIFQLLAHEREDVRTEAARLIERLAQSAARPQDLSIRIVANLETERDEIVIAHLVLALGHVGDRPARTLLEALLDAHDPFVRVLAAVGLPGTTTDPSPPRRLQLLVDALALGDEALAERYEIATSRALTDDLAHALTANARDAAPLSPMLLAVLAQKPERELPEAFLEVVLDVLFPDAPEPIAPTALTREQRLVLRRLSTATERLRGKDRDFTSRLAAKGLPTDPRSLARFYALN